MQNITQAQLIATVLDAAADPTRREAILRAARGESRPLPGTIREAAAILNSCPRTIERYVRRGLLHPIRISARRIRYDLREVERLATQGVVRETI
jgi:hypothetical protein